MSGGRRQFDYQTFPDSGKSLSESCSLGTYQVIVGTKIIYLYFQRFLLGFLLIYIFSTAILLLETNYIFWKKKKKIQVKFYKTWGRINKRH